MSDKITRRRFLRGLAATSSIAVLAACQPQIVKETVIVEKPVDKIVKETVVVEKPVEKVVKETVVVEKVVKETVVEKVTEQKEVTVRILVHGGADRMKGDAEQFARTWPDTADWLKVEYLNSGAQGNDTVEMIRLMLAAGEAMPEIAYIQTYSIPEFVLAGALYDLTGFAQDYADDITDAGKALMTYRGRYWAAPSQIKSKLWFYRKDLFEEAGIVPDEIKTPEDYIEAGVKFHEKFPDHYIMNQGPKPAWQGYIQPLSHFGSAFADDDGNYLVQDDPAFAWVMEWLKSIQDAEIAFPVDDWAEDWRPAYADEKICGWMIPSWGLNWIGKLAPEQGGKWDLTLQPEFIQTGSSGDGGAAIPILNGCAEPEAAWEYMRRFFFEAKGQFERWKLKPAILPCGKEGRQMALDYAKTMTKEDWMTDDQWKQNAINYFGPECLDVLVASQAGDIYKRMPMDPNYLAERTIWVQNTEPYLAGEISLEEALAKTKSDMETQIGDPWTM